jgi:hypothetical protein
MNNLHQLRMTNQNPEKSALQKQNQSVDNIWEKLKRRAEQVGYGSLICEMQVHQGQIRQVDITTIKERMRAD